MHLALGILAVPQAEYDDVAFVPLDAFQVLDEELLLDAFLEVSRQFRPLPDPRFQLLQDGHLLGLAERDHSEGQLGTAAEVLYDHVRDHARLRYVPTAGASVVAALRHMHEADAAPLDATRRGEGEQPAPIEVEVGERYERFILAAIVPSQHPLRKA